MIFLRGLFILIILIKLTESERKSKRTEEYGSAIPTYEVYNSEYLPSDKQITTFLIKGEVKVFYYRSPIDNGSLSTTIITCSSSVQWSFKLNHVNSSANAFDKSTNTAYTTEDITTKSFTVFKDLYLVQLKAKEFDTYVHIYISTEVDGPLALRNSFNNKLRLQKRQKRKRLTVRWDPSLVDPQGTDYCLTVSTKKNYKTLCAAQAERFRVVPPSTTHEQSASQTIINWPPNATDNERIVYPLIACVGRKRQHTVSDLKQGEIYHFDLFATNRQSNLTYLFGTATTKFDTRIRPISLRDNKPTFANLKKFDGKVVFKYKVGKRHTNPLNIFIIPCGSLVKVEVTLKGKIITTRERVEKFDQMVIKTPVQGARYNIKILAVNTNGEYASRNSGVEILATSKPTSKIPLPTMPFQTTVKEYESLRRCDRVTIAWLPSPGGQVGHYCIMLKELPVKGEYDYDIPNQCGLENRLKKSVDTIRHCKDVYHNNTNSVITEEIKHLRPGRSYFVQVIVKKPPKGKSLAYDPLQVHTAPCHRH